MQALYPSPTRRTPVSAQWLLVGLDHGNASNRPKRRLLDRALAVAIGLIVLLLCYGVALFSLSRAWQNFEWTDFWMSAAFATLFGFLIPFARFMNIWSERRFARAQVTGQGLREIAATGNDQVAPPVAFQPMPLSLSDLPSDKPIIGPLKGLLVRPQGSQPGRTWILLLPIVIFAVFIPLFSLSLEEFDRSYSFIFDTLPFLAPVVFIGGLLLIVGLAYRGQTFSVNVDQAGFEWVTGRTRRRLAWDDVRSIFRFIPAATTGYTLSGGASWGSSAIYFIDGRDEALTWTIMPLASEQSTAASETLQRLAVTRTGKPLRDLTLLANEVATSGRSAEQFLASRYPVVSNQDNQSRCPPTAPRRAEATPALGR